MKKNRELSSLDISAMVKELQDLVSARVKKIYQIKSSLYLVLHKGKTQTLVINPNSLYLTKYKLKFPEKPLNFCMLLRKHLGNSKLLKVKQHEFERIVEFEFSNNKKLVAELFSKGNVLLLENSRIIMPMHIQSWKHRTLKPKLSYEYPPKTLDPRELNKQELSKILKDSDKDLVRALAVSLSFGGLYAEEISLRSNIEKNKNCKDLTEEDVGKIQLTIKELFQELEKNPWPNQVLDKQGKVIDFSPIKLLKYSNLEYKPFKTFSEACDEFYIKETAKELEKQPEKEKLEKILETQLKTVRELEKKIPELKKKADKLGIEQKFREAEKIYAKYKRSKKKLTGLKEAIQETSLKLKQVKPPERVEKKIEKKKEWFEKFRWFKSSDNFLIIGGKDATTNEIVVKKHTEPNDLVFHADITGAPFCIIKTPGKEVPKNTLEETAQFAASYSKAWSRGLGAIDVYYVNPDQVSKKAPSGEYVPRGGFMIHGHKNYLRNTELGIAFGIKGSKLIHGPERAVKRICKIFAVIKPGNTKSKDLAQKIRAKLKLTDTNPEEIQKFIPSGKGSIKQ